jgi:hypothetical protein
MVCANGSSMASEPDAAVAGWADANDQRPARSLARPVVVRTEPRVRAALPFALCDVRPVRRPTVSSTQAPILSKRPSALLRRELLTTTPLLTQVACQPAFPGRSGRKRHSPHRGSRERRRDTPDIRGVSRILGHLCPG